MPFAATWVSLEIVTLSRSVRGQTLYDVTYMWNLKYATNELNETETYSQTQKANFHGYQQGKGVGEQQARSLRLVDTNSCI